jgi:hypothetical protein
MPLHLPHFFSFGTNQFSAMLGAYTAVRVTDADDKADYYNIKTTYSDISGLATPMKCIVAPNLCDSKHDKWNYWCMRASALYPPPNMPYNIRKIILCLKKLYNEVRRFCGKLLHNVFFNR